VASIAPILITAWAHTYYSSYKDWYTKAVFGKGNIARWFEYQSSNITIVLIMQAFGIIDLSSLLAAWMINSLVMVMGGFYETYGDDYIFWAGSAIGLYPWVMIIITIAGSNAGSAPWWVWLIGAQYLIMYWSFAVIAFIYRPSVTTTVKSKYYKEVGYLTLSGLAKTALMWSLVGIGLGPGFDSTDYVISTYNSTNTSPKSKAPLGKLTSVANIKSRTATVSITTSTIPSYSPTLSSSSSSSSSSSPAVTATLFNYDYAFTTTLYHQNSLNSNIPSQQLMEIGCRCGEFIRLGFTAGNVGVGLGAYTAPDYANCPPNNGQFGAFLTVLAQATYAHTSATPSDFDCGGVGNIVGTNGIITYNMPSDTMFRNLGAHAPFRVISPILNIKVGRNPSFGDLKEFVEALVQQFRAYSKQTYTFQSSLYTTCRNQGMCAI